MAEYVLEHTRAYYPELLVTRIINAVIGVVEFMLALRLVLELLNASESSPFVAWVYDSTNGFVAPFSGAFPALSLAGTPIDLSVILAMISYAIVGWLIIRFLSFMFVSAENL